MKLRPVSITNIVLYCLTVLKLDSTCSEWLTAGALQLIGWRAEHLLTHYTASTATHNRLNWATAAAAAAARAASDASFSYSQLAHWWTGLPGIIDTPATDDTSVCNYTCHSNVRRRRLVLSLQRDVDSELAISTLLTVRTGYIIARLSVICTSTRLRFCQWRYINVLWFHTYCLLMF